MSRSSRQRGHTPSISQLWYTCKKAHKYHSAYVDSKMQSGRQDRIIERSLRHVLVQSFCLLELHLWHKHSRLWAQKGATEAFQIQRHKTGIHIQRQLNEENIWKKKIPWLYLCYQIHSIARLLQLSSLCWCLRSQKSILSCISSSPYQHLSGGVVNPGRRRKKKLNTSLLVPTAGRGAKKPNSSFHSRGQAL